jgi:hypothetical protein
MELSITSAFREFVALNFERFFNVSTRITVAIFRFVSGSFQKHPGNGTFVYLCIYLHIFSIPVIPKIFVLDTKSGSRFADRTGNCIYLRIISTQILTLILVVK